MQHFVWAVMAVLVSHLLSPDQALPALVVVVAAVKQLTVAVALGEGAPEGDRGPRTQAAVVVATAPPCQVVAVVLVF